MTVSGLLRKIGSAAALGGALLFGSPNVNAQETYWFGAMGMGINSPRNATIKNIPESIRNVPAHPDDHWCYNAVGPINDTELDVGLSSLLFNLELGVGIKKGRFAFEIGPNASFSSVSNEKSDIIERNYTNAPGTSQRGYGAALTYYKVFTKDGGSFSPGIFSRLLYSIPNTRDKNLFLEYSLGLMCLPFYVETGWDRWDELETDKVHELSAYILNHTIKLGCEFIQEEQVSTRGFIGLTFPQTINQSSSSKSAELALSPSFCIGVDAKIKAKK